MYSDTIPNGKHKISSDEETRKRWPTSWWTQYKMLCWRGFKQTKGVLKQGFTIAQILIVTAVVGMIYFQIDMEIYSVRDVMGLVKILYNISCVILLGDTCNCIQNFHFGGISSDIRSEI